MPVLVVGMPHSGADLLADFLHRLGMRGEVDPGLIDAVRALNTRVLAHFGGALDAPPTFPEGWVMSAAGLDVLTEVRALVAERTHDRHFVLTDAQLSLLLPLWRQALGPDTTFVVTVREPMEVAIAARAHQGGSLGAWVALWQHYYETVLHDLDGARVLVLTYDQLVGDPLSCGADVADQLSLWGDLDAETSVADAATALQVSRTRYQGPTITFPGQSDLAPLSSLLATLLGAHDVWTTPADVPSSWWSEALLDDRRALLAHQRALLEESADRLAHVEQALNDARETLASRTDAFERERATAHDELARSAAEVVKLRDELDEANDHVTRLRDALEEGAAELVTLRDELKVATWRLNRVKRRWFARFLRELTV